MIKHAQPVFMALFVFLGVSLSAAGTELSGGAVRLVLYPETGGFALYRLSEVGKNRYMPLYEDRNGASTSWFSALVNGRVYRLSRKFGKPVALEQTAGGYRYTFALDDDFLVTQDFSLVNDPSSGEACAVRVDTTLENTSGKPGSFALKALFDTILGEPNGRHFSTNIRTRVSSETRMRPGIEPDTVILSGDTEQPLMFLLSGNGVTPPEAVYIANWERLKTLSWLPESREGRSFNTLYAVNDSAVLFVWPERKLEPNEALSVSLVLGLHAPGLVARPTVYAAVSRTEKTDSLTPAPKQGTTELDGARMQLVQQLLDRIAEIQANPASASDEELAKLNNALDVMLEQRKE